MISEYILFCSQGNLQEETDMEVGNETSTMKYKVQDSATSFLTENSELRTEPIEIDQRRRRSSQKFGIDHNKVNTVIRCIFILNELNIFYKQQKCNYFMLILL